MAVRAKEADVKDLLGGNYDVSRGPTLRGFIRIANATVTRVLTCATNKGKPLTSAEAENVEQLLAAHLYMMSDKAYASRSTAGKSASFQGQTGMGLDSTDYGQAAQWADPSGCLVNLWKRQTASADWLGKPPSEQIDYVDRD